MESDPTEQENGTSGGAETTAVTDDAVAVKVKVVVRVRPLSRNETRSQ